MRIAGLATGMDINQIVSDLMKAHRMPIDKMMQDRQLIEWRQEGYREINRKFNTFRDNIFDTVMRSANMLAKSVSSSNSSLATATATSTVGNMSLRLSNVTSLAKAASYNSSDKISADNQKINTSATLGSQNFTKDDFWEKGIVHRESIRQSSTGNTVTLANQDIVNPDDIVVKVNGKVYDIVTDINDLEDGKVLLNAENGTLQFNHTIQQGTTVSTTYMTEKATEEFNPSTAQNTFQLKKGGLDLESLKITAGGTEFTSADIVTDRSQLEAGKVFVNVDTGQLEFFEAKTNVSVDYTQRYTTAGISAHNENGPVSDKFVFTANQSLNTVFTEMNRSNVGVQGFYDNHSDQVSISRSNTGLFNVDGNGNPIGPEIEFTGFFNTVLKFDNNQGSGGAQNAVFQMNGLQTQRQSNTFTVSGMTVTLNDTFTNEVTLRASTDTDKVFDTIKGFVNEYNELLDFVNGKLTEDHHRDFRPLTEEQKAAMSEKEIEQWEERAQSGLLRNDPILRGPMDRMRTDLYNPVNGGFNTDFKQLASIGITTSNNYMDRGKLVVNEDKLRQAIEQDPEGVFQLFTADGAIPAEQGIARRVRTTLDQAINSVAERAGGMRGKTQNNQFTLGRNMNQINDQISSFERRLQQVEERYWRQFNAMDAAVQRANQQAETLFAQLYPQG
ncbi:flagellar filament capping protein FliD [Alkalihalobacterium alkalinitrilicum]|uniref:flagellar filament capping protein FliD n=1 Tax=Alkalihalobacterium alkalinitrilicum TaxID=427920 RepID=UPI000995DA4F|nr:flagellar filament capping protein FliD [Alkalihalobacterium alkalinitrilicum]